ncbi:hypothetical protein [Bacillus sp. V2I10]|uniref:hypothetical protein n=1 Tax=Bacillus sp. V2I10 TaxID=3042276 RepID=UPI00278B1A63|nr:hypothetical protein [Bacillus sp. V2I10]MDQ0859828.1 hypothetical protein [Bacillus sp. V2I10]
MIYNIKTGHLENICFKILNKTDVRKYRLNQRNGWFDWDTIIKHEINKVFGLFVEGKDEIQGVIAIQEQTENQIIHIVLMESAPHNKFQSSKQVYSSVGKNLLAFAMCVSFSYKEFEGYVGLYAKLNYNELYYSKLKANLANYHQGRPYMYFDTEASQELVSKYMPGGYRLCQK